MGVALNSAELLPIHFLFLCHKQRFLLLFSCKASLYPIVYTAMNCGLHFVLFQSAKNHNQKFLPMGNYTNRFIVNIGLLVFGIASAFSGMLIQLKYHMGNPGDIAKNEFVLGTNYYGWAVVHKISIVVLSLLMIYHIYDHWKWYKAVIKKRLFAKNQQVLIFSLLFLLVAITGLIPWFVDLSNGDEGLRKAFIEVHDKLTIILTIYLLFHIVKRLKWYYTGFERIST